MDAVVKSGYYDELIGEYLNDPEDRELFLGNGNKRSDSPPTGMDKGSDSPSTGSCPIHALTARNGFTSTPPLRK